MSEPTGTPPRLTPDKRALLDALLRREGLSPEPAERIPRRPREGPLPLSFAQERLWFIDQLEPGKPIYNLPAAVRLFGALDVRALEGALNEVVRRHEALRTVFDPGSGVPRQRILLSLELSLAPVDLRRFPETERNERLAGLLNEEAQRPFDLARGPLLHAVLYRLGEADHVLLLVVHHIVSDGWSTGILVREMAALYQGFLEGRASPLEELPIQYGDFSVWQREWLRGEVLEAQLEYWRRQLGGTVPALELPSDRPRPAVQTYRGSCRGRTIPAPLAEELQRLGRREGCTLFMTLLAAFQVFLFRYTGEEDVRVGVPIANRNRVEIEGLIGFFANTLVMRADLSANPRFLDLLARVREAALGAFAHQDLPFEKLVEALQPERDLARNPMFQVLFVLQNTPMQPLELPGLKLVPVPVGTGTAKFDLMLSAVEEPEGLKATVEYSTDLFDTDTAERMLGQFETLLSGIAARPEERIADLPLLPESERRRLRSWNETKVDYPERACVHDPVELQAQRMPDRLALLSPEQGMTYSDLEILTRRLGGRLHALGAGPGRFVGIFLERSLDAMVAVLATLRTGAAYLPLDPSYPRQWLAHALEDARPTVVLTGRAVAGILPPSSACLAFLEEAQRGSDSAAATTSLAAVGSEVPAYLLYTSGSTGRPKGVVMTHRSLVNLLTWQLRNFSTPAAARTLQLAPLSFDVSFQEIFSTWHAGGTLVLAPEEARRDPNLLLSYLDEQRVERAFLPYVALSHLAEALAAGGTIPRALKEVITAGETLRITPAIASFFERLPGCVLHNQYGPTEAHVVTCHTLQGAPGTWPALPGIGQPIANCQVHLVDRSLQPVPIGVPGEIALGGVPPALGYWDRPDVTAEHFIPDPFSSEPGVRLYRTGDRGRWRSDGNLEFLGRGDDQIKIRGFRVEPGEIESTLEEHSEVRRAVVVAREGPGRSRRLVAYVVPESSPAPPESDLRRFVEERLPEFMVPSFFVTLNSLPLTPSGKVDRRALPLPDPEAEPKERWIEPQTTLEKVIAQIWSEVLGVERVGLHDNFFALGGHSLIATQVISRLREVFQTNLPLRRLFERPTVSGLGEALIEDSADRRRVEKTAALVLELSGLSDQEAEELLNRELGGPGN